MKVQSRKLVLFDFDGTLTTQDTLFAFARFVVGDVRFVVGMLLLSVPMGLHKLKLLSARKAKETFLQYYFGGMNKVLFESLCEKFSDQLLPKIIRSKALETIQNYRAEGAYMVIVSASADNWIRPWAKIWGIEVIATKLEVSNSNRITGRIEGENCNGNEKVTRIKEVLDLRQFDEIVAFGDTTGDLPMLALAGAQFYKPFR